MGTISFKFTLPRRPGAPAAVGGWTYHHYLPWRYYYSIAYALTALMDHLLKSTTTTSKPKFLIGYSVEMESPPIVSSDFHVIPGVSLTRLHTGLCTMSRNSFNQAIRDQQVIDAPLLCRLCANPNFGGFAGMDGQYRGDDPKERPETLWPRSDPYSENKKACLDILRGLAEECFPNITIASEGATIAAVCTERAIATMANIVHDLSASKYNTVPPFQAEDWVMYIGETQANWFYFTHPGTFSTMQLYTSSAHNPTFHLSRQGGDTVGIEQPSVLYDQMLFSPYHFKIDDPRSKSIYTHHFVFSQRGNSLYCHGQLSSVHPKDVRESEYERLLYDQAYIKGILH